MALACLDHLSDRVLYYVQLVEDLGLRSVQARIAHTLLSHAELKDGALMIPRRSWTTLNEMAARLGTVRDVLSRSLNALESEGILHLERSRIVILDPQKLLERGKAQVIRMCGVIFLRGSLIHSMLLKLFLYMKI